MEYQLLTYKRIDDVHPGLFTDKGKCNKNFTYNLYLLLKLFNFKQWKVKILDTKCHHWDNM